MPDDELTSAKHVKRDRAADLRWIALARLLIDLAEQLTYELDRIDNELDLEDQLTHELRRVEEMIAELSQRLTLTQGRLDELSTRTGPAVRLNPPGPKSNILYPYVMAAELHDDQLTSGVQVTVPHRLGLEPNPRAAIRPITQRGEPADRAPSPATRQRTMIQTINYQTRVLAVALAAILLLVAFVGVIGNAQPSDSDKPASPHTGAENHSTEGSVHILSPTVTAGSFFASLASPTSTTDRMVTLATPSTTASSTPLPQSTRSQTETPPSAVIDASQNPSTPDSEEAASPSIASSATVENETLDQTVTPATLTIPPNTATVIPPPVSSAGIVPGGVGSLQEQIMQVFGPHDEELDNRRVYQGGSVFVTFSGSRAISVMFMLDTDDQVFTREEADELATFYRPPDADFQSIETFDGIVRAVYTSATLEAVFAGANIPGLDASFYVEELSLDPATGAIRMLEMTLGTLNAGP